MGTYHLAYKGGTMAETDAEREASMAAWGAFLGGLGDQLVDAGNPFGPASTVAPGGAVSEGAASGLSGGGYVITSSVRQPVGCHGDRRAQGCPILSQGRGVEAH